MTESFENRRWAALGFRIGASGWPAGRRGPKGGDFDGSFPGQGARRPA
jgi:hypothetical protein